MGIPTTGDYAMGYAEGFNDACKRPAPPPPECKTEAEQTAYAFGWWKALESVRTEQPAQESVAHTVIAGALFDFMGYLTSRKERIVLSAADDTAPAADAIRDFATKRGLSLDDAQVREWIDALAQPAQEPVETWEDLHNALQRIDAAAVGLPTFEVRHEGGLDAVVQNIVDAIVALHEDRTTPPAAQPAQEPNNFCPRCGKRLQGVLGQPQMHTCTPPLWGHI